MNGRSQNFGLWPARVRETKSGPANGLTPQIHVLLEAQAGTLSHRDTMRSLELFGKEVIPALQD